MAILELFLPYHIVYETNCIDISYAIGILQRIQTNVSSQGKTFDSNPIVVSHPGAYLNEQ